MLLVSLSAGVSMLYNATGIGPVDDAVLRAGTIVTSEISIE
jgi:hypothetical protein